MKRSTISILLGVAIIAVGVIYAGNAIGFWPLDISFEGWWTLFIIIPCALSIINGGLRIFNCVGVIIGTLFLLTEQDILKDNLGYKLVFPIILIAIGVSVIFRKTHESTSDGTNGIFAGNRGEDFFAIFGGNSPQFRGEVFGGANTYAIFGGVELRLHDAIIKRDCVINTYSIFGSTEITLPENVRAVVTSTPVFGGLSNKFRSEAGESAPKVYIRSVNVFGGTDIK